MTTEELIANADAIRALGDRLISLTSMKDNVLPDSVGVQLLSDKLLPHARMNDGTLRALVSKCLIAGFDVEIELTRREIEAKAKSMQPVQPKGLIDGESELSGGDWYDKQEGSNLHKQEPTGPAKLVNPYGRGGRVTRREHKPPAIIRDVPPVETNPLPPIAEMKDSDAT